MSGVEISLDSIFGEADPLSKILSDLDLTESQPATTAIQSEKDAKSSTKTKKGKVKLPKRVRKTPPRWRIPLPHHSYSVMSTTSLSFMFRNIAKRHAQVSSFYGSFYELVYNRKKHRQRADHTAKLLPPLNAAQEALQSQLEKAAVEGDDEKGDDTEVVRPRNLGRQSKLSTGAMRKMFSLREGVVDGDETGGDDEPSDPRYPQKKDDIYQKYAYRYFIEGGFQQAMQLEDKALALRALPVVDANDQEALDAVYDIQSMDGQAMKSPVAGVLQTYKQQGVDSTAGTGIDVDANTTTSGCGDQITADDDGKFTGHQIHQISNTIQAKYNLELDRLITQFLDLSYTVASLSQTVSLIHQFFGPNSSAEVIILQQYLLEHPDSSPDDPIEDQQISNILDNLQWTCYDGFSQSYCSQLLSFQKGITLFSQTLKVAASGKSDLSNRLVGVLLHYLPFLVDIDTAPLNSLVSSLIGIDGNNSQMKPFQLQDFIDSPLIQRTSKTNPVVGQTDDDRQSNIIPASTETEKTSSSSSHVAQYIPSCHLNLSRDIANYLLECPLPVFLRSAAQFGSFLTTVINNAIPPHMRPPFQNPAAASAATGVDGDASFNADTAQSNQQQYTLHRAGVITTLFRNTYICQILSALLLRSSSLRKELFTTVDQQKTMDLERIQKKNSLNIYIAYGHAVKAAITELQSSPDDTYSKPGFEFPLPPTKEDVANVLLSDVDIPLSQFPVNKGPITGTYTNQNEFCDAMALEVPKIFDEVQLKTIFGEVRALEQSITGVNNTITSTLGALQTFEMLVFTPILDPLADLLTSPDNMWWLLIGLSIPSHLLAIKEFFEPSKEERQKIFSKRPGTQLMNELKHAHHQARRAAAFRHDHTIDDSIKQHQTNVVHYLNIITKYCTPQIKIPDYILQYLEQSHIKTLINSKHFRASVASFPAMIRLLALIPSSLSNSYSTVAKHLGTPHYTTTGYAIPSAPTPASATATTDGGVPPPPPPPTATSATQPNPLYFPLFQTLEPPVPMGLIHITEKIDAISRIISEFVTPAIHLNMYSELNNFTDYVMKSRTLQGQSFGEWLYNNRDTPLFQAFIDVNSFINTSTYILDSMNMLFATNQTFYDHYVRVQRPSYQNQQQYRRGGNNYNQNQNHNNGHHHHHHGHRNVYSKSTN